MWVHSRQFTGRIVTVSNDKIFDEPVYNYTFEFPFLWEEMRLPIRYQDDRQRAEEILLEAAAKHAIRPDELDSRQREHLERRYDIRIGEVAPRVYWRITDNWLELTVRFLAHDHGTRQIKDAMSREIMARLDEAGIGIASATYEITALPPVELRGSAPPPVGG
jgi:small-conductance mechanosensitive channel